MNSSAGFGVGVAAAPRASAPALTSRDLGLDDVWPEVSAELVRYLRRRGATPCQAQDVAQDVAVKVLTRKVAFTSAQDLLRWCYPVARNGLVDLQRAGRRVADEPGAAPELPAVVDVHAVVEARMRLERVVAGFRRLEVGDQEALRPLLAGEDLSASADRREATRLAVRRHRARARLTALVGPAATVVGWVLGTKGRPARRVAPGAVALPLALAVATGALPQLAPPAAEPVAPAQQAASHPGGPAAPIAVQSRVTPPTRMAPAADRVAAAAPAPAAARELVAVEPAEGLLVRVESQQRDGAELVCLAHDGLLEQTCVDEPEELPPSAAVAERAGLERRVSAR